MLAKQEAYLLVVSANDVGKDAVLFYWLAIIGVLTSVVSVFFYLRIVVMSCLRDERLDIALAETTM